MPPSRRLPLAVAALLALLLHAALLLPWPGGAAAPARASGGLQVPALETRTITEAPTPAPAPEPVPAADVAPVPAPAPVVATAQPAPRPQAALRPARPATPRQAAPGSGTPPQPEAPTSTNTQPDAAPAGDASSAPVAAASAAASGPATAASASATAMTAASGASAPGPAAVRPLQATPGLLALSRAEAGMPETYALDYAVTGQASKLQYQASGTLVWHNTQGRYKISYTVSAFLIGKRTQTSEGTITAQGLRPERFADIWRGEQVTRFAPGSGQDGGSIQFSKNGAQAVSLLPGAQDQLSVFLQLAALFSTSPDSHPPGSTLSMQVAGDRNAPIWDFVVQPPETISVAGNQTSTVKLVRKATSEEGKTIEIWLSEWASPAGQRVYLPARMRITKGASDFVEQNIKSLPVSP